MAFYIVGVSSDLKERGLSNVSCYLVDVNRQHLVKLLRSFQELLYRLQDGRSGRS